MTDMVRKPRIYFCFRQDIIMAHFFRNENIFAWVSYYVF